MPVLTKTQLNLLKAYWEDQKPRRVEVRTFDEMIAKEFGITHKQAMSQRIQLDLVSHRQPTRGKKNKQQEAGEVPQGEFSLDFGAARVSPVRIVVGGITAKTEAAVKKLCEVALSLSWRIIFTRPSAKTSLSY